MDEIFFTNVKRIIKKKNILGIKKLNISNVTLRSETFFRKHFQF